MLNRSRIFFLLMGLTALAAVACTSSDQSAEVSPEPTEIEAVEEPTPEPTPAPTSTPLPRSTVTPTPEPEGTPASESESVMFYLQAYNAIGRGEYIEAERTFTTVIELEPTFARGWDGRGQALMLQGKYEEALHNFDRAIELKPNLSEAYANRALTRIAIEDIDGADRDARRAFELDELSVAAHLVLGRVYARQGDTTTALEWFDLAIATDPEDASTWWWRGRFYRDVLYAGNAALDDFNKAIELSPAQAALYLDRAQLYISAQVDPDLARADLEEAISLSQDPKLPTIIARAEELLEVLDEREPQIQ
jgi:tetratricopeptide (TPR) repeat protein